MRGGLEGGPRGPGAYGAAPRCTSDDHPTLTPRRGAPSNHPWMFPEHPAMGGFGESRSPPWPASWAGDSMQGRAAPVWLYLRTLEPNVCVHTLTPVTSLSLVASAHLSGLNSVCKCSLSTLYEYSSAMRSDEAVEFSKGLSSQTSGFSLLPPGPREPRDLSPAAGGKETELPCGWTDGREKMSTVLITGTTRPVTNVLLPRASPLSFTLSGQFP